jgi:hypothetical protein
MFGAMTHARTPRQPTSPTPSGTVAPAVYIVNASTNVTDDDARAMTEACALQIASHVAPAYGRVSWPVAFAAKGSVPAGGYLITIMDQVDDPDALGYHTEDQHGIWGVVGTKPVLDHGAKALSGDYAVSTVLSHEVAELFCDPTCASWSDSMAGHLVSTEVCDPVQSDRYGVTIGSGASVDVSNFVLPSYFDAQDHSGRYDYLGKLRAPFSMSSGGYLVTMREGRQSQQFGEEVPQWWREVKGHTVTRVGSRADGSNTPARA